MPHEITIHIVDEVADADLAVLRRYLANAVHLSEAEWRHLRNAINHLSQSEVNFSGRRYTFRRF